MKNALFLLLCLLGLGALAQQPQQEKARLERERQEIQAQIREIQQSYNKVKGLKKETLGKLQILQEKLALQDRLIGNINKEIKTLNDDIYLSNVEIYRLQTQLDTLKAQYARSVVYAYKNQSSYNYLNFIFSANSFNDALKRVSYLKAYRGYRQQQVTSILDTKKLIEDRKTQLLGKQKQKTNALQNQQAQLNELANQKKEKDQVVAKLKSQESTLSKQIAAKKKRDQQLKNQVAAIVRREIEAARRAEEARLAEERRRAAAANPTTSTAGSNKASSKPSRTFQPLNSSAADIKLNSSFEQNRGRLPWPVDNGVVTVPFGPTRVEGLSLDNPGITISTPSAGTPVKAVFDGVVSAISNLGEGYQVTIRHGQYFTAYWTLTSVSVSKGDQVKAGTVIGRAGADDDGSGGLLDFMLMKEYKQVNPAAWLRK